MTREAVGKVLVNLRIGFKRVGVGESDVGAVLMVGCWGSGDAELEALGVSRSAGGMPLSTSGLSGDDR
jgi:hypothetical protein